MKRQFRRFIPIALIFVLLTGMMPFSTLSVQARQEYVSYLDRIWDENEKRIIEKEQTKLYDTKELSPGIQNMENGKWYYTGHSNSNHILIIYDRVTVHGNVNLILCDDIVVNFYYGIDIPEGSKLTIYGGTKGTGAIYISSPKEYDAAIGGGKKENGGSLIVKGGIVTAKSTSDAPAIGAGGGDYYHQKGDIIIYGGTVSAVSGKYGAGIGAGYYGNLDGNVIIYGGTVTATGGMYGSGIGGGEGGNLNGTFNIFGGTVTATGGKYASGIGGGQKRRSKGGNLNGKINISGGTVTAQGGDCGAGIGGGEDGHLNGTVNISGGTVKASSGESMAAGIGGGENGHGGTVNISGGSVTATGGNRRDFQLGGGAGIGGGDDGDQGGTVTITGGTVNATGIYGAGIGGGSDGNGGLVNISGGKTIAYSETYGAGIGGGEDGKNGTINISGGNVSAKAKSGCGIGCGWGNNNGQGGDINITGGFVEAASLGGYCSGIGAGGGDNSGGDAGNITIKNAAVVAGSSMGAGIGGGGTGGWGSGGNGGNIVLDNSAVFAMSAKRGSGIGGGEQGNGGTISIHNSYVEAVGGHDSYNYYQDKAQVQNKFNLTTPGNALSKFAEEYDEKIADLILYYMLSGEWGGSGIGGGVNGNGGNITITGTSSVIAMGGMSGASAIGHGTGKSGNGTLSILDNHWVKAGTKEDDSKRVESSQLTSACHNNQFAMVLPACEHPSTSYRYVNQEYHEKYCKICGDALSEKEKHTWNQNTVCTVCGFSSEQTEIIMKLRGQGGSYKKMILVPKTLDYVLPECPDIPRGREFICWRVNGGEYSDAYYDPGDTIKTTVTTIELTAVYAVIKDTEYINEWGEKNTIPARQINASSTVHNIYLTTGWYAFNNTLDIPENIVFLIDGNVNLIIPDGYNINFDTAAAKSSFSGDNLSIFGQKEQTGTLNFRHSDRNIHSLTMLSQYGGNIKADNNSITCGKYNIKRGSVTASKLEAYQANILGGRSEFGQISAINLLLGWTGLTDSISIGTINTSSQKLTITKDQAMKDSLANIYTGSVKNTDAAGQILTPYLEHNFGDPEWLWKDNISSVQAKFTCTDEGCGKIQTVDANITAENHSTYTTYTAVCNFYGKTYTDTRNINTKWDIVVRECDCGTVTANKTKAEYGENITLNIIPDEGYILTGLTVINEDDENDTEIKVSGNCFTMPAGKAVISATFMRHFEKTEPYIDDSGAYIAGNIEYFTDPSGKYYYAAADGTVGEQIDENKLPTAVILSYFVFMPYSIGWQITKYNGSLNDGDVLYIPETYDGKPVICVGRSNPVVNSKNSFKLELNKNISIINYSAFRGLNVTTVTGDTSGLKIIQPFAFANADSANNNMLDIKLDYPGTVKTDWSSFQNVNVTFHLKHTTDVSDTSGASSTVYDFTDTPENNNQSNGGIVDNNIKQRDNNNPSSISGNNNLPDSEKNQPEGLIGSNANNHQISDHPETGDISGNALFVFIAIAVISFAISIATIKSRRKKSGNSDII